MILSGQSHLSERPMLRLRETAVLFGFMLFKFIFQYTLTDSVYELHRDEFLHIDQGNHLAWGYISVPPATAFQAWLLKLVGHSDLLVRFFPALWGTLTIAVVWKTVSILGGNLYAKSLSALCVTFSVLLRINGLFQPNSLEVLCWTSLFFGYIAYTTYKSPKWLWFCSVVFAIGFLNKYSILLPVAGLALGLLLTPQRKIFLDKKFWLSVIVAFVLISPNIIWQFTNDFPVIWHMKELSRTQLENVSRIDFLKTQPLFFLGGTFVIISGLISFWRHSFFHTYRFVFCAFAISLLLLVVLKAKDYYAIGLYPILIAFGSVYISQWKSFRGITGIRTALFIFPVVIFIPMYNIAFPNRDPEYIKAHPESYRELGMLKWEDGKNHPLPQDFADMLGWKELASKVDAAYRTIPQSGNTLILCDNYGQAGAINYYGKCGLKAVTFNADYINWFLLEKQYSNLIRVKEAESAPQELAETASYFKFSDVSGKIKNENAREFGTTIFVFSGATIDISKRIEKEVAHYQHSLK